MVFPESLQKIIDYFKLLPGVGEKTAIRYAFSILKMDENNLKSFSKSMLELNEKIDTCPNCGCLRNEKKCTFCENDLRQSNLLCVVESKNDVFVLEKNGYFNGKYHVLGGLISPIDGVNPEDISINKLISRVEKENIKEIILALKPGVEGNTTSLYIKKILENKDIKITQIAQGIPIGADMEYLDDLTIEMALENRSEIS